MKKVNIVLLIITIILGLAYIYMAFIKNNNDFSREDENFYEALSLLKENKYSDAYQKTDKIKNTENQKTIKNIIAYSYLRSVTDCLDDIEKSDEAVEDAIDQARYSSIYGNINISDDTQNKIDNQNKELMQKYGELNTTYPKEILYDDLENLYNSFGQIISSYNGLNSNMKEKLSSETEKDKYLNDLNTFIKAVENGATYINDVEKLHPLNEIPEKYRIMFELDNKNE